MKICYFQKQWIGFRKTMKISVEQMGQLKEYYCDVIREEGKGDE